MRSGKVWGTTEQIEANGVLEFHRIEMKKGGVCSKHLHKYKWNGFFCESGQIIIRCWKKNYDLVDETVLNPGDYTKVPPGEFHQFECTQSGVTYELYWAEFNHDDIERETVGYAGFRDEDLTIDLSDSDTFTISATDSMDPMSLIN